MVLRDGLKGMLRKHIADSDKDLSTPLDFLWQKAKAIHNLQNKEDGTENGRIHVETVEYNIWRLLTESLGIDIEKFGSFELFLLSASACCHDFDKAQGKLDPTKFPEGDTYHGKGSSDYVLKYYETLGFTDKYQAEDVAGIINIHDLKDQAFEDGLKDIPFKNITGPETFNHKILALILKAADILHTDHTRVIDGTCVDNLSAFDKSKYYARSSIKGWEIDGSYIFIKAQVENDVQKKAIEACEEFMKNKEWPCVEKFLGLVDFPYRLDFIIDDRTSIGKIKDTKRSKKMKNNKETESKQNRPHTAKTHLKTKETDAMLHYAIDPNAEQFPICFDEQITHMAGVAAGRMAVLSMLHKAENFKEALSKTIDDLTEENVFSPNKLNEHILCLTEPKVCVSLIIDEGSTSSKRTGQNTPLLTFQRIPDSTNANGEKIKGGSSIISYIKKVRNSFDALLADLNTENNEIASEIKKQSPEQQVKLVDNKQKYRSRIKKLLHKRTPKELKVLIKNLEAIVSDINILKEALREDWTADTVVLWNNKCEPFEKRVCTA